ncbi:hypothetical protein FNV43_RR24191 [Rhamnella rubrinervis]|uniref:DEAD-box ATP-dependent RNA helicase 7 n=1 Tax=Rhamnella rubrinervis TaxID=2594499 RepID=A0A8K0GNV7_9ROSA|nr:hypothetical protein FNV43_RR24191 [Rhamnella rubrinervis]
MPSLDISDYVLSVSPKDKKEKKKKMKNQSLTEAMGSEFSAGEKKIKEPKLKKRKALEIEADEDRSETSSELGEPVNSKLNSIEAEKKKKKKARVEEEEEKEVEGKSEEDPNALSRFRISEPLKAKLNEKGIQALFPIQAMTFDTILDGSDLVGRARTGQGKTLAFVLPILESLTNGPAKSSRKTGYGKSPSVLVLLPTRELANQVYADFEVYGGAVGLSSCCLYGGAPYHSQELKLKRGVDIVVGTPGRIKDHLERDNIDFSSLKFRVLDEADEMLRMGFVEDVELILGKVKDVSKVQTLLFSATLPHWVKDISSRFLKPNKKTADLVGNEKMKASTNVRHIVLPCSSSARSQLIPDIIRCYSSGGRTIVFTETKDCASELSGLLPGARALHGDIQQAQREVTLRGFRSGKFMTLVATNVAARGLDINDVQLIIQCEPPRDVEAYIHRSGRTGRAGNTGVAVMLYDPRKSNISKIERESGVKFEHVSAPQPLDVAKAAGVEAVDSINQISDSVIPAFKSAAEELLNTSSLSAVELLAKALAKAAGYSEIKKRSLLSSMENHVTVLLEAGKPIFSPSFAYGVLRRFLPEEKVELVKGMALTSDGRGAVFDVPAEDLDTFLAGQENAANVSLEVVKELPSLQEKDQSRGRFGGRGGFSGGSGNRFSSGRGSWGGGGGGGDRRNDRFSNRGRGRGGQVPGKHLFRLFKIMGHYYRRSKLVLDAFRGFTSKISLKAPTQHPSSISTLTGSSILAPNTAKISEFSSCSAISQRSITHFGSTRKQCSPFLGGAKRCYYVDRYHVQHFRPRGPRRWFQNSRNVLIVVLVGSGVLITVYYGNLETIPYTKRTHFVLLSKDLERRLGDTQFKEMKAAFKGKILPAIHPESVRIRLIANDIIKALQRGLKHERVWSDLGYASESVGFVDEDSGRDTLMALKEFGGDENVEGKWFREDEILDDKWVQQTRKKGQDRGAQSATSHLEGLNWEVLVVKEPVVNALCLPGGKIVVFTGLLDHFRSDAEIATIIGHEVGHAVARHAAEGITKNLWFAILQLVLYQFVMPDVVNAMSTLFLRLPFSRRMEIEADYIGLLLMASAGYDPRVAPKVYEKLGKVTGESALRDYLSTHPSGKKRSQLLAQAKVMEEALHIYMDERAGRGIEGFL